MNDWFKDHNGKPLVVLGMQHMTAFADDEKTVDNACETVRRWGGNTITVSVWWERVEPEEGKYDTSGVKALIERVRKHGLHLLLIWFGTSKNGHPNFAPRYVKEDPSRYQIALGPSKAQCASLSPHCRLTMARDALALCKVLECVKECDQDQGTVLGVQVENEMGYANTDMDYSDLAQAEYRQPLPEEMVGIGETIEDTGKRTGERTWRGEFGRHAHEAFSAYAFAKYADYIAMKAKQIFPLPMYCNAMIGEQGMEEPGLNYNAGAPVGRMLEVWKRAAVHIDLLGPDVQTCPDIPSFTRVCSRYAREDNALFLPECHSTEAFGMNIFRAFADYRAVGLICNHRYLPGGELSDAAQNMALSVKMIDRMSSLLIKHRGDGNIHYFAQDEYAEKQYLALENWHVLATFTSARGHGPESNAPGVRGKTTAQVMQRGRCLLYQEDEFTFYVCGCGVGLDFRRRPAIGREDIYPELISRQSTQLNFDSVWNGHFDENGRWISERERNGDETNYKLYLFDGEMVRIRLNPGMIAPVK